MLPCGCTRNVLRVPEETRTCLHLGPLSKVLLSNTALTNQGATSQTDCHLIYIYVCVSPPMLSNDLSKPDHKQNSLCWPYININKWQNIIES